MKSLFDFNHYREYLKAALPVSGPGRGARARLAEALGCQPGFVSLVLSGGSDLALEHAFKTSDFLKHTVQERDYFLLLVHLARAGSKGLESYYREKIEAIQNQRREVKERIRSSSSLTLEDQLIYYSSWHYSAVHMCLMIPRLQTPSAIRNALSLSASTVSDCLEFLARTGLARAQGERFVGGPARMHLPADSPLISRHHANWRIQALKSLDERRIADLHYSAVISISMDAAEEIRKILLNSIQQTEPALAAAKDEKVFALNLDLFEVV